MAAEMAREIRLAREIGRGLGLEVELFMEHFDPLPKPYVRLFGAAANAAGRPLANVVELSASNNRYMVVVELPRVQFCENEVEWTVNHNSEVTIEGQITPAAIFADKPTTGNKRNRVQLCPTEPWAISFYFPGPVDWWTTSVMFTSDNFMEILVMKRNPQAETSASRSIAFPPRAETSASRSIAFLPRAETSASGSTTLVPVVDTSAPGLGYVLMAEVSAVGSTPFVPVAETSASSSTAFVPAAETSAASSTAVVQGDDRGPGPEGDTWLASSEIMDMVDGWFE